MYKPSYDILNNVVFLVVPKLVDSLADSYKTVPVCQN